MEKAFEKNIQASIRVDDDGLTENYCKFVCEPLERGYGLTLGNALRRVILSSMVGAAITSIKIQGVLHELSTIDNVKEDVSDIILNLKEVRLKLTGVDFADISINAEGPREVKAGDIVTNHLVEVLNKDLHIATLANEGKLEMTLRVEKGRGYVPAEKPGADENQNIGTISVDAMFSPIHKVNFNVTNTTHGKRTDYDKLAMEIWTDGSITPQDALNKAASIITEQLAIFTAFKVTSDSNAQQFTAFSGSENDKFNRTVDELDLSVRAANCLKNAGINLVGDLVQKSETEMLRTKNFGRKSLIEIKEVLTGMGLSLGMQINFP
ncbi:MAG: DNA-directed RNA polymerase subunit alpha [Deltaproteobacteria bacterium]|jgi:DNA-directed RNA polymerase subunit alpha|nr:DNA-directed RNA polymerase subunit alpha [Deltaproteobacteria bacterium]